ncbi:MAG TPA: hypothetical protein PL070_18360, partial [Flavobacteriales bacterium]|nr:hypothetical protein [Flavobacteriales bacterium]
EATPVELFPNLNGTPVTGGTWSGPSDVVDGLYDPTSMTPGNYVYTIPANGPCAASTAQIVVTEIATTNAGNNVSVNICNNATSDLFDRLTGGAQFGGTWTGPDSEP